MGMLVLIRYGLSVVVSRFFFSFFLFLSGKKKRRLFGLRLLFRKWRDNFIL